MTPAALPPSPEFIPRPALVQRYGVTEMTLSRWEKDVNLSFPEPLIINRRKFYRRTEIEAWEQSRIGKTRGGK